MKVILEVIFSFVISIIIFTAVKYLNVFQDYFIAVGGTVTIYFFTGMLYRLWVHRNIRLAIFIFVNIFLLCTIFVMKSINIQREIVLTTFSLAGFITGYYFKLISAWMRVGATLILCTTSLYSSFQFFPAKDVNSLDIENEMVGTSIHNFQYKNLINNQEQYISLENYINGYVVLLEFYFNNCPPCIKKKDVLKKLEIEYLDREVLIIYINAGNIDDIQSYLQSSGEYLHSFYDRGGLFSESLDINSFPFELIIDQKGYIRYVSKGYGNGLDGEYLKNTRDKIKKLLNE